MQVIIKEREYEYCSDYDEGWEFSSGDDFKFPVKIGRYRCFIKRFARNPERITGWRLLQAIRATSQPALPRLHDIVQCEEEDKKVRYVFYESMEGCTLDKMIQEGETPDTAKLVEHLFKALGSIHRLDHWFVDFCEKNIFCTKAGDFLLIDLDSVHPSSAFPDNEMYGSKEYWALVFSYFVKQSGLEGFKPADISGPLLNYLQVVFLALRIRAGLDDRIAEYKSTQLFERLPSLLDETVPEYKELFGDMLRNGVGVPDSAEIEKVRDLLIRKIVHGKLGSADPVPRPKPGPVPGPDLIPVKNQAPVVYSFTSDKKRLPKGGLFTLRWEVEQEDSLIITRDTLPYKHFSKGIRSIVLTERYDGKEKKIVFAVTASNPYGTSTSQSLALVVGSRQIDRRVLLLIAPVLAILILLLVFLGRGGGPHPPPPKPQQQAAVVPNILPHLIDSMRRREDSIKRREDSVTKLREQIIRDDRRREDSLHKHKDIKPIEHVTQQPPRDSSKVAVIDEAAEVKKQMRRERLLLEKKVLDSLRVVDTIFSKKKVVVFNSQTRKLGIENRSGFFLDTVVVDITQGAGSQPERRSLLSVQPHSFTVLIDKMRKDATVTAVVRRVIF